MNANTDKSAESNPAVFRCCQAWRKAYAGAIQEGKDDDDAQDIAREAYADALPPLIGVRNIRSFIACVAHGSAVRMLNNKDTTRLLYAAQVAFSTRRMRPARPKNTRSSSKKSHSGAISGPKNAIQEPFFAPTPTAQPSPTQ